MKKFALIVAVLGLFLFNIPTCNAYEGESAEDFISDCLYGNTWAMLGTGVIVNFNEENLAVEEILDYDDEAEEAFITVRFTADGNVFNVQVTPVRLNFFNPNGTIATVMIKFPPF